MMKTAAKGFTLIELMVAVAIIAILAGVAAPSFTEQIARRRLEGAATELSGDLQYARTEAISKNVQVALTTTTTSNYNINYVAAPITPALKSVTLPTGVSATNGQTITFTPLRGMTTAAVNITLSHTTSSIGTLQLQISAAGRIVLCSPSGGFKGYPSCA